MVSFFLMLRRFIRALVGAWRRDEEFRSLAYLVLIILASGTRRRDEGEESAPSS
jgi:hypothetical protein